MDSHVDNYRTAISSADTDKDIAYWASVGLFTIYSSLNLNLLAVSIWVIQSSVYHLKL